MTPTDRPLTPLTFLERSASVYPDQTAVVDDDERLTWAQAAHHATRFANALLARGLQPGDRVAYLCLNSPALLLAHFAVPLAGGVLVPLNTRLVAREVDAILQHCEARFVVVDESLVSHLPPDEGTGPVRIVVPEAGSATVLPVGAESYEAFLASGTDDPLPWEVADEDTTISINYTSGTTGRPKGVEYTHRGAFLAALNELIHQGLTQRSRYLWTLPMFHCNGWCTPWAVTAAGARHVIIRAVRGPEMWRLIEAQNVTHLCGAPTVLTTLVSDPAAHRLDRSLTATTAGAPPSPTVIRRLNDLGVDVVHVYGLTETYGPITVCEPQPAWEALSADELAVRQARQGVGMVAADRVRVVEPDPLAEDLVDVPADGTSMGEIVLRGNCTMKGYFQDEAATAEAFRGGWFHSGDLGVMHPDGYVQLLDRAKDVIVSGGENISTVEVEQAIVAHAAVADVAVVSTPHEKWGETPKAFVVVAEGASLTAEELVAHTRGRIAPYKVPRAVEFVDALPRTSTGKVRKNELRDAEWAGRVQRIQG